MLDKIMAMMWYDTSDTSPMSDVKKRGTSDTSDTYLQRKTPLLTFYIFVSDVPDVPRFTTSDDRRRVRRSTTTDVSKPACVI